MRPASLTPHGLAWALFALALGGVAIGVGEFVPMALLPEIGHGIHENDTTTGHVVSAYALGVVVGAPVIATLAVRVPRRALLVALMAAYAIGNVLSAIAPGYGALLAARFLCGLPHGAFFGVAALVAATIAGPERRAWAVGRVMLGLSVANVVGVPAATWLGQSLGWRTTFAAVAAIALLAVLALMRFVATIQAPADSSPLRELGALKQVQVWLTLGVAAIGLGGLFAVYSYITPTLTHRAGISADLVPFVLSVFGLGMIAGNLVGGWLVDRALVPALYIILTAFAGFLAIFAVVSAHPVGAVLGVFLVGTGVSAGVGLQTRLMDVAHEAQTLAAALNHAAFNAANALGPWLGGLAIAAGYGWQSPALVGVGLAGLGLCVFTVAVALERRTRTASRDRALVER
ncbi:MAG TPA: MFS transporter [Conexibacter sp.]